MPIEFRCTSCGKLLRTPDDSAGRDAQCPSCGAVVPVPMASQPEAGDAPFGEPAAQPAADTGNPYQSPAYTVAPPIFQSVPGIRSGPPWERDGASLKSFIETAKLGLAFNLFPDMRREGGLGGPIGFVVAGGMIGFAAAMVFQISVLAIIAAIGQGGGDAAGFVGFMALGMFCGLALIPVFMIIATFINAGITHLMLILLKGNHFPFETTFRVVAYSIGLSSLLLLIPMCGQYISGIVQIVLIILGLISAQEISGGKATAAVLLPIVVMVGLVVAVVGFAIVADVQRMGAF